MKNLKLFPFFIFLAIFCLTGFSSMARNKLRGNDPRFYTDVIFGLGRTPIISSSFGDDNKANFASFSIHPRYYLTKKIEIESGFGYNAFGHYYSSTGDGVKAKYFEIPIMIRTHFTKLISIGIGPTYNLLRNANAFSGSGGAFDVDITDKMEKGFWGACVDTRLGYDNVYLGLNFTHGIQPIRSIDVDDEWNAWTFKFYLGINFSEIIRIRVLGIR